MNLQQNGSGPAVHPHLHPVAVHKVEVSLHLQSPGFQYDSEQCLKWHLVHEA